MDCKIAYIMSRFPHLPETFILREMNEMAAGGMDIALYPLIFQHDPVVHPEAAAWIPKAHVESYISRRVLASNTRVFFKKPLTYLKVLGRIFVENWNNPNFLVRGFLLFPKIIRFSEQMQAEGIGHIHAHYASHPALAAWVIHEMTGIPYSVTVHAHDIYARTSMLDTKMRPAEFIASISAFNRDFLACLVKDQSIPRKTRVVHCGIFPEKYGTCEKPLKAGSPLEIICVGSLKPIKGQRYLVEACRILKEKDIPFHCTLVGDGPEMPDIRGRVERYSLQDYVTLAGSKDEEQVSRMLPAANCYVQPSLAEGIPVAIMEALCTGLPVVATAYSGFSGSPEAVTGIRAEEAGELIKGLSVIYRDLPQAGDTARALAAHITSRAGIAELVKPGVTGLLVPPADPEALAAALITLYEHPEHANGMADAGRELVLNEFNLHENATILANLFNSVAGK